MKTGLYIHLPFCKQKCNYCDFASFAGREFLIDGYLDAMSKEAARSPVRAFETLYVGGGTPSVLSAAQLEKLAQMIEKNFGPVSRFEESTCEANPESLTPEKISVLKEAGFNRLSIGLQSFNDDELKTLGRVRDAATFLGAYEAARAGGLNNINVDLIAGLPGQTLERFLRSLRRLVSLRPEHLSVYGLQIEEGTPFFERGVICDQLLMRRMLEETRAALAAAGYHHYEISNFARPGLEAKHNTHYWNDGDYIGLGSAAASFTGGARHQNTPDVCEYIRRINADESPVEFSEKLEGKERAGERLMLALRKLDGVELSARDEEMFGREIEKHVKSGLLLREGKKVKLSFEGLFLANEVFCSFVAPFEEE
ncbi:MAG: radical SAM family heme chaperone HemW [Elusimicrobiaceae bacterium]|nr:radical SAM family heme chaperone HemW [Elusimicrobiaceae bacterium]